MQNQLYVDVISLVIFEVLQEKIMIAIIESRKAFS
jgi:hypothetical protein